LNYLAFVGTKPFETDGQELVGILPPEVMREHIRVAKAQIPGPDNSWAAKAQDLIRELVTPTNPNQPVKIEPSRLPGLMQDFQLAIGELERRLKLAHAAEAKMVKAGDSIPQQAGTMIERAQVDMKRANPEEKAEPAKA
jgi:hypothetical protein